VVSQIALALPMCLLYEIGIFVAQAVSKRRKAEPDATASPE
jgi:Sec-independent protein secretion pathway component TatC